MKKISILLAIVITFFINNNVNAATEWKNLKSKAATGGHGSNSTSETINKNGGTIEANGDFVGVRISIVDKEGKTLSNSKIINVYKDTGLYSSSNIHFYNKNNGNKSDVMDSHNYSWEECKGTNCVHAVNGFKLGNVSLDTSTDDDSTFFKNIQKFINNVSNEIKKQWKDNKNMDLVNYIFVKFKDKNPIDQKVALAKENGGTYILFEPINTYMIGTNYAATDNHKEMYKIVRAFLNSNGDWDTSKTNDDYYNIVKNGSTLKSDFIASITDMKFNINGSTVDGCTKIAYDVTGGQNGYTDIIAKCKNGSFDSMDSRAIANLKKEVLPYYIQSFKDYYNNNKLQMKAFKQEFGTNEPNKDVLGAEARLFFIGTPSELYEFSNNSAWKNNSTVKNALIDHCKKTKYLKNDCDNYINNINKFTSYMCESCRAFNYLRYDSKLVNLKYTACNNYASASQFCGLNGLSVLADVDVDDKDECGEEEYNKILELGSLSKIQKETIKIKGEIKTLDYCCAADAYGDSEKAEKIRKELKDSNSKIYKICHPNNCTVDDYIAITKLSDWGDDPEKPANKITSLNSSVEGKTLDYCCDVSTENYGEDELDKINTQKLGLKNPTNGEIIKKAKEYIEKKCKGPSYCGEDAYNKMKMVENNEILLSKAKTKIGAVTYNLEYCCEIDNWTFDNDNKFLPTKLATKSELEQLLFKVCNIPTKDKCTWNYLNDNRTRYYYKDGNSNNTNPSNISDCCDYNEIKDSLPDNMTITKFHQQQAYKDAGCGACEYKVVNGTYQIVLTDKLKKQGKTEKYCCDNNENQWEGEDNPQYISFKKNTTYMAQLGCAQAACSWDKNKDEKTRYSNGVDCCVATNYETNDIINGLKKEGINISSNPTQSQIISKFKESNHYKNMKCNACTPESINSKDHPCCSNPEMYDNTYRSKFRDENNFDEVAGLKKYLRKNYSSIYDTYCKHECTLDTVVSCPNCDTIPNNGFISGVSYDIVEYNDGPKDSTSINDINEDEKKCIVSENKFLNEDIGNKYCKVYCTEKIVYDYPEIVKSVEAGRKYPLGVASITTVKTCRINGIDEATFKSDLNAKAAEIKNAYDDYLKYKQAKKDAKIVTKAYDAKDKNNTCDCVNNASTTINGTTVSRNCCSQISTKISTVTTHTETLASTIDKSNLDMNTFRTACSQKNGRQSGNKCYYCDDGKKPNSNNKCEGPEVTSCSSPGSEYTLVNSTTCEYAYCSTIDNTKYGYQKVEKYEYGVDTKKTNQEGNICETPENKDKMYTVTYPKNEEEAWNKVNVLQGEFDAIIKQYKECFDIPNTILNLDDYDFNINVDYSQGDYSHSDKMEKSLVSSQVFEDDRVKSSNRISKSYGNIKVKVTRDKYNKEQLVIDNIYQGDLSKTIYSVSVQRQYKYVLTTGYTYINKGKPQSVTEKLQELQQIEVAAHLPVSYDYTEDGNITLSTTLDSDNARSDLALCTVDQNSDYELSCPFSVYDRLLLEPGGVLPVYRPIILSNPFPDKDGNGRNTGVNWCYENNCTNDPSINKTVYNYITNNRGRTEENVYNLLPLYTIKLTPADVQNIRNYNKATNYNDFRLICNNGKYCESIFLRGIYTLGYNEQSDIYKVSGVINDISNLVDKSRSCALNQNLSNCNYDDYFSASLGGD